MKNKKSASGTDFLESVPCTKESLNWTTDEKGNVILELENKGAANRIAQMILKKPKKSYIHLDEMGNYIWPLIDGKRNIAEIGKFVSEKFGDKAEPLYERLSVYFRLLEKYGFIRLEDCKK